MLCGCPPESSERRNGWDFAHRFGPHCRWHHDQQTWRGFGALPPGWTHCWGGSSGWAEGEGPLRREWGRTVLQLRHQLKEKIDWWHIDYLKRSHIGCKMRNKVKWTLLSVFIWRYLCFSVTEVETMRQSDDNWEWTEGPERDDYILWLRESPLSWVSNNSSVRPTIVIGTSLVLKFNSMIRFCSGSSLHFYFFVCVESP